MAYTEGVGKEQDWVHDRKLKTINEDYVNKKEWTRNIMNKVKEGVQSSSAV